jgi:outer membrane lipoprotein-sorting protein
MDVERPNKIRVLIHSATSDREIIYDGKTMTLYTPAQKYYSTGVHRVDRRADRQAGGEVCHPASLQDLFLFGTPAAPLDKIESAMNADRTSSTMISVTTTRFADRDHRSRR